MNLLAYILYLLITWFITVHVGLRFYRNGRLYILRLLHGDEKLTDAINRILLTGYYLLNLGYATIMLRNWQTINDWAGLVSAISSMTGKIILTLAIMHFMNMAVILYLGHRHQPSANNKNEHI
jgi:hypothetical protein